MMLTSCPRVRELVDSYVSGELSVDASHAVQLHARDCPRCRAALGRARQLRRQLRAAYGGERAPDDLRTRIVAALDGEEQRWRTRRVSAPRVRPLLAWSAAALVGVVAVIVTLLNQTPIAAAELLRESIAREATEVRTQAGSVVSTVIALDEQVAPQHFEPMRRMEVLRDPARQLTVRRAFNEDGRLVAGEWLSDDGSTVLYRPGERARAESRVIQELASLNELWRLQLSARDFSDVFWSEGSATAVRLGNVYAIRSDRLEHGSALHGELLLAVADLRPIQLTVDLLDGARVRTFRLSEISHTRRDARDLSASLFEPDRLFTLPVPSRLPNLERPRSAIRSVSPHTELDLLYRLHRVGADVRERLQVSVANGRLEIKGVIPTVDRRAEVLSMLTPTGSTPDVTVDIVIDPTTSAASINSTDQSIDSAVYRAQLLVDTVSRFPPERRKGFGPDSLAIWHSLLRDHARAVRLTLASFNRWLVACRPSESVEPAVDVEVSDASTFARATARLLDLVTAIAQRLASPPGSSADSLCAGDVPQLVRRAIRLADEFGRPWPLEP